MRILLLGSSGLLGTAVQRILGPTHELVCPRSSETDLTDPMQVADAIQPPIEFVVNCAAYTAVDLAESEREAAIELNTLAPGYIAGVCAANGIPLIHISTDFVFDGQADNPYSEEDRRRPLGAYGMTKADGEDAVSGAGARAYILRTSWLFGPEGKCFPRTILKAYRTGKDLRVVDDQFGTPTSTDYLARVIERFVDVQPTPGIYHAAGTDVMTWFDLAQHTLEFIEPGFDRTRLSRCNTDDYPTPARRPQYSALNTAKLRKAGLAPEWNLKDELSRLG